MPVKKLRFALFGNVYQAEKSVSTARVMQYLASQGIEMCVERGFLEFLRQRGHVPPAGVPSFEGSDFEADYVISMGGDGTFLNAARLVGRKGIPIVGVNTGRLGFLADITPQEIELSLRAILRGEYRVEEHTVIMMHADDGRPLESPYALNDIAVLKRDNASMISIRTEIDGEYLMTYQADGLIVSTPTGSTAYSLSNGGPILAPATGVVCLTPVAPHSLNVRPLVVPDTAVVRLSVTSRSHQFLVAVDGRSQDCTEDRTLVISKAPYVIRIIKRPDHSYFATLREKMMWGADTR